MAKNDVELVIKAKNEASRAVDAVVDALKALTGSQDAAGKSAGNLSGLVDKLGGELDQLKNQSQGLAALGKIATQMDKAAGAVGRLEGEIVKTDAEVQRLARDAEIGAAATNTLKVAAEQAAAALQTQKAATAASRKEQTAANKELRSAETALNALETRLAKSKKPTTALVQSVADQRQKVADLKAAQTQAAAGYKAEGDAQKVLAKNLADLNKQISAAEGHQRQIQKASSDAAEALLRQRDALVTAQAGLQEIATIAGKASSALGDVAVSQEQISVASKRAAEDIAAVTAALDRQHGGMGTGPSVASSTRGSTASAAPADRTVAGYKAQVQAVRDAQTAWREAQADAGRLATAIKATDQPTEQMRRSFLLAQEASKSAKAEFLAQSTALRELRNVHTGSFQAFSRSATQITATAAATSAATGATNSAANAHRQLAPAVSAAGSAMGGAAGGARGLKDSLTGVSGETRQAMSLVQRLRGEVLGLAASYIGFQAATNQIGGVISAYRTLEAAENRLGAVFDQDTKKVGEQIVWLQSQAQRLGINFGTLSDEYSKFAIAADQANFSQESTRKIFLAVAEAARVNKLSVDQTSGVFLAFTQMVNKGKIQGEELTRQLSQRLPGAFNIVANAIGVTTGKLTKMMEAGDVLANEQNLVKIADELTKRFGPQLSAALETTTTEIGRFQNSIFNAQLNVAQGGFIEGLNASLKSLNAWFNSTDGIEFFASVGAALGKFASLLSTVPPYFDLITIAAETFVAVKLAGYLSSLAGTFGLTARAVRSFQAELSFVGPPTQALTLSQRTLGQTFAQTVDWIGAYKASLLASVAPVGIARVGTIGFATALGLLRSTLITIAAVARATWIALGGLPGLILTGITFAVGSWLTSIDSASTAIDEHKRKVDSIVTSYDDAKTKAEGWASAVKTVSVSQAQADLKKAQEGYNTQIAGIVSAARQVKQTVDELNSPLGAVKFAMFSPEDKANLESINRLVEALSSGSIGLSTFKNAIDAIANTTANETIKEVTLELQGLTDGAKESEKFVADAKDILVVLTGTSDQAAGAIKRLKGETEDTGTKFSFAKLKTEEYNDALDKLKAKIPGLAEELKKMKEFAEVDASGWIAITNAVKAGDFKKALDAFALWGQARTSITAAQDAKTAAMFPIDSGNIADRIVHVESGGNPYAKAGTSNAAGLGQFIPKTWLALFDKVFPDLVTLTDEAKLALRYQEEASKKMLDALIRENQAALVNKGISPDATNTYLAHFLGAGDAIKVILANPDELAASLVKPESVAANPSVFKSGMTAGDLRNWSSNKMGSGSPIMAGGQTEQEKFDQTIKDRVQGYREEATARGESNKQGEIAKAVHAAEVEALQAGTKLTQEQTAAIRESVGARYDALHAGEAEKKQRQEEQEALNQVIGLDQQRRTAAKELQLAMQEGDQGRVGELQQQVADLNKEITDLLPKALALAQALGDEKGVAALAKVTLNAKTLKLELISAKEVNDMLASGMSKAFDEVAKHLGSAIAGTETWGDAIKGVGLAFLNFAADFLREIAMMILKQLLLNALQKAFPGTAGGGGIGGAIAGIVNGSVSHDGSVIGVSGESSRRINPALWNNALSYHNGGLPGLEPDEVRSITKVGEEVLKKEDPRNVLNGGGTQKDKSVQASISNILLLDPDLVAGALASAKGNQVLFTFVKANSQAIKKMLK